MLGRGGGRGSVLGGGLRMGAVRVTGGNGGLLSVEALASTNDGGSVWVPES